MKMKKVLLIAHSFPPKSGPGVHRSRNLAMYLQKFDYEPIILTIDSNSLEKNNESTDFSLLEDLPKNLKIYGTKSYSLKPLINFFMKIKIYRLIWFVFYPIFWESSAMWPFLTYRQAKKIIRKEKIDLIYTSSGPFSSMFLGYFLQKKFKLPWVADLRDPFTDAYAWLFPSRTHWFLARKWEKWMFAKPNKIIVNTHEVKKLYLRRKLVDKNKIAVINNGY